MGDIHGIVPYVEKQDAHGEFVDIVEPDTILLNLIEAREIVNENETASSYFNSNTTVIVTSTIQDQELNNISWKDELKIVKEFNPDYHIPTDYSIYGYQTQMDRVENMMNCMKGTEWMKNKLEDKKIQLIPLVKGFTRLEREICYRAIDSMKYGLVAYYCTQYFSGGQGNRIDELVADITQLSYECDFDVLLVGLLSPTYLERMPQCVVAASGMNQWLSVADPRKCNREEIRHEYECLSNEVNKSLLS